MDDVEVAGLTRRWWLAWPGCPPIGHLLRGYLAQRWVRLHSLPESKRYADTEAEYATMLRRHNTVLTELAADEIYLITQRYGPDDLYAGTEPIHIGLHPGAVEWMTAADPEDPESTACLYVSRTRYTPGSHDRLLRQIADDVAGGVIIADTALSWLYHPYDGGADVILLTTAHRDQLRHRHQDWLPVHPSGL